MWHRGAPPYGVLSRVQELVLLHPADRVVGRSPVSSTQRDQGGNGPHLRRVWPPMCRSGVLAITQGEVDQPASPAVVGQLSRAGTAIRHPEGAHFAQ